MPERGFLGRFYAAISDFSAYKEFVKLRTGQVIGYFLVLAVLISLVLGVTSGIRFMRSYHKFSDYLKEHLPTIVIENGEVSVDVPQPFTLYQEGEFTVIIDTTGQTQTINGGILIKKTSILIANRETGKKEEHDLSRYRDLEPLVIDNRFLESLDRFMTGPVVWSVILLSVLFGQLVLLLLFILLLSPASLIYAQSLEEKLTYPQMWTVGIFALTGPVLLSCLYQILITLMDTRLSGGIFFFIFFGVYSLYLILGLKAAGAKIEPDLVS